MSVFGYSERGIFNSIVYYLDHHPDRIPAFLETLGVEPDRSITGFTFLVEQSFENYGGCDLVILGEGNGQKTVLFIEGKTKTDGGNFSIKEQFAGIKKNLGKSRKAQAVITGNIFAELLNKYELQQFLRQGGQISSGNKSIKKSLELIKGASDYYFIAVLPQKISNDEFRNYFSSIGKIDFHYREMCETKKDRIVCGFWGDLYLFFKENNAEPVIKNFEYNEGRIYEEQVSVPKTESSPEPWYGERLFIKSKSNKKLYHMTCDKEGTYRIQGLIDKSWEIIEQSDRNIEKYRDVFRRYKFAAEAPELNLSYPKNITDFERYVKKLT